MRPEVNMRHVEDHLVSLEDQLTPEELDIDTKDDLVQIKEPLEYELEVQKTEDGLLAQGALKLMLDCQCARCLKPFQRELELSGWVSHIPLEGEEKADVVNDVVDLTPYVREDIVLAFPQRPLCGPDCEGLPGTDTSSESPLTSNPWAELNKLKLE
jgi:uncharacterized metal-binding protein YceD (DUF177 family)